MKSFQSFISEEGEKIKRGKEVSVGKNTVKINPDSEELKEVAPPTAKAERMVKHIKKSYSKDGKLTDKEREIAYATAWKHHNTESAVPGQPAERLGAVTAIPKDERDAARERTLAKAKAARLAREKGMKEEFEIEEGMTMKDFKKQRSRQKQKDKREAEKTSPTRRAGIHDDKASPERAARHRANVDPDYDYGDEENMYPGGKLKNPKKIRKAKATGEITEMLSFSQFMEARRMDREGVDRGDAGREQRAAKAKASLAAKAKRDTAIDKYEKSSGRTVDRSKSPEYKSHAAAHPGSRQEPKVKGAKETPAETHSRRVNRQVARVVKHGHTSKERKEAEAMSKHTSRFD